jgi:hypothetical protein
MDSNFQFRARSEPARAVQKTLGAARQPFEPAQPPSDYALGSSAERHSAWNARRKNGGKWRRVSCHYFPKVLSVSVKNPSELAILCPLVFLGWVYVPVIAEYRCSADGGRFWTQETQ